MMDRQNGGKLRATKFWEIDHDAPFGRLYLCQFIVSTKMLLEGCQANKDFYIYGYSNYTQK
jgi:hypothetical protein